MQGAPGGGEPRSRMLVETQALWSRAEEKDLHQETTFSAKLLQHVQLVLPTPTACLPHAWHCDPGPCAGIICIFVFPPLPGWEHFSLSASQGQGAGSQLAQMCSEGHGVQEEGHGVNTACGRAHESNKTSRPFAHSLPFLYLSLIKLCKEMS